MATAANDTQTEQAEDRERENVFGLRHIYLLIRPSSVSSTDTRPGCFFWRDRRNHRSSFKARRDSCRPSESTRRRVSTKKKEYHKPHTTKSYTSTKMAYFRVIWNGGRVILLMGSLISRCFSSHIVIAQPRFWFLLFHLCIFERIFLFFSFLLLLREGMRWVNWTSLSWIRIAYS